MQAEYEPYKQLIEAVQERVAIIRGTSDTSCPLFLLEQSWVVDAGVTNQIILAGDVIVASGFPDYYGEQVDGDYTKTDATYYRQDDGPFAIYGGGGSWIIDEHPAFFGFYYSDTGPESDEWYEFNPGDLPDAVTAFMTPQTNKFLLTTNVVTTNAVEEFEYDYTDETGTYTATGFPYVTYAALAYIDTVMGNVATNFIYTDIISSNRFVKGSDFSGGSGIGRSIDDLDYDNWGYSSVYDLLLMAGIGGTYTNITASATNLVARYTRQPEIETVWLLGEWVWTGDVWTNTFASAYDMKVLDHSLFPAVMLHSTNGTTVEVTLEGSALSNLWQTVTQPTYATNEVVNATTNAVSLTHRWHSITNATFFGGSPSTNDYITVAYRGPVVSYGARPYRLYASDLEERAAVLDEMRWTKAEPSNNGSDPIWYSGIDAYGNDFVEMNSDTYPETNRWDELIPLAMSSGTATADPESYWNLLTTILDRGSETSPRYERTDEVTANRRASKLRLVLENYDELETYIPTNVSAIAIARVNAKDSISADEDDLILDDVVEYRERFWEYDIFEGASTNYGYYIITDEVEWGLTSSQTNYTAHVGNTNAVSSWSPPSGTVPEDVHGEMDYTRGYAVPDPADWTDTRPFYGIILKWDIEGGLRYRPSP